MGWLGLPLPSGRGVFGLLRRCGVDAVGSAAGEGSPGRKKFRGRL